MGKRGRKKDQVEGLEPKTGKIHDLYEEDVQRRTQYIWPVEERLKKKRTNGKLFATTSVKLRDTHFLINHLSGVKVVNIVRDLNENIYQVAVNSTDEWEKMTHRNHSSNVYLDPALVQKVPGRDPVDLTFLFQSCVPGW